MKEERISDTKLYELVVNLKKHTEDSRDEINKYYTSLFTGIVAFMPFAHKFCGLENSNSESSYNVRFLLILLSIVTLILSLSWVLTLKRIYNYLEGMDKLLIKLEEINNISFIRYLNSYLYKNKSPDRVTKQQMWVPYTFIMIFSVTLLHSIFWILFSGILKS